MLMEDVDEGDERGCLLIDLRQEVAEGKSFVMVAFRSGIGTFGMLGSSTYLEQGKKKKIKS